MVTEVFVQSQSRQGIGGFAGLTDRHDQAVGLNIGFPIAELARNLYITGHATVALDPLARHHGGMVACATSDDLHVLDFIENNSGVVTKVFIQLAISY